MNDTHKQIIKHKIIKYILSDLHKQYASFYM